MDKVIVYDMHVFIKKYAHKKLDFALRSSAFLFQLSSENAVVFDRSCVIYVPLGVACEDIFYLDQLCGKKETVKNERLIFFVDEGASIKVHDTLAALGSNVIGVRLCEIILADNAQCEFVIAEDKRETNTGSDTVACYAAYAGKNATFRGYAYVEGKRCAQLHFALNLQGRGAQATFKGAVLLGTQSTLKITSQQNHTAPHTQSDLSIRGVVGGASRFDYHGMIHINGDANESVASQDNKNLLLSSEARAVSVPSLEVKTDAVQCAHGSAVGYLDEDALLYASTRGLDEATARQLMIEGFLFGGFGSEVECMQESVTRGLSTYCS